MKFKKLLPLFLLAGMVITGCSGGSSGGSGSQSTSSSGTSTSESTSTSSGGQADPGVSNIDITGPVAPVAPKDYTNEMVRKWLEEASEVFDGEVPEAAVISFRYMFNAMGLELSEIDDFLTVYMNMYKLIASREVEYADSYEAFKTNTALTLASAINFLTDIGASKVKALFDAMFSSEYMAMAASSGYSRTNVFGLYFTRDKYIAFLNALKGTNEYEDYQKLAVLFDDLKDPYGVTDIDSLKQRVDFAPFANLLVAIANAFYDNLDAFDYFLLATNVFGVRVPQQFAADYQSEMMNVDNLAASAHRIANSIKSFVLTEDSYGLFNAMASFKDLFSGMTYNSTFSSSNQVGYIHDDGGQYSFFDNIKKVASIVTNKEFRTLHIAIAYLLETIDADTVNQIMALLINQQGSPSDIIAAILPFVHSYINKLKDYGEYDTFEAVLNKFGINLSEIVTALEKAVEDFDAEFDNLMTLLSKAMAGLNIFGDQANYRVNGGLTQSGSYKVLGEELTVEDIDYLYVYKAGNYSYDTEAKVTGIYGSTDEVGRFLGYVTYDCPEYNIKGGVAYFTYVVFESEFTFTMMTNTEVSFEDSGDYYYFNNANIAVPVNSDPEKTFVNSDLLTVAITKDGVNTRRTNASMIGELRDKLDTRGDGIYVANVLGHNVPYRLAVYSGEDVTLNHLYLYRQYILEGTDPSAVNFRGSFYYTIFGDEELRIDVEQSVNGTDLGIDTKELGMHEAVVKYMGIDVDYSYYVYSKDQLEVEDNTVFYNGPVFIYEPGTSSQTLQGVVEVSKVLYLEEYGYVNKITIEQYRGGFSTSVDVTKVGTFTTTVDIVDSYTGTQRTVQLTYYVVNESDCTIRAAYADSADAEVIHNGLVFFDQDNMNDESRFDVRLFYYYGDYQVRYYDTAFINISENYASYNVLGFHEGKMIDYEGSIIELPSYYVYSKDQLVFDFEEEYVEFSSNYIDFEYYEGKGYYGYSILDYDNCYIKYYTCYALDAGEYGEINVWYATYVSFAELGIPEEAGYYIPSYTTPNGTTLIFSEGIKLALPDNN